MVFLWTLKILCDITQDAPNQFPVVPNEPGSRPKGFADAVIVEPADVFHDEEDEAEGGMANPVGVEFAYVDEGTGKVDKTAF